MQRLEVEVGARALERWAPPRLQGIVGERSPDVWVSLQGSRAVLGISSEPEADDAQTSEAPALAFDVHLLTEEDVIALVVSNARGANLAATPTALAIGAVEALLGRVAERAGAVFTIPRAAAGLARQLWPEAGARVPDAGGLRWTMVAHGDAWLLQALRGAIATAPTEEALRAQEVATIVREGDEALVDGDTERARSTYLAALERAPRHREIVRRVADIDSRAPGREEAALSMFAEVSWGHDEPRVGMTRGALLASIGDVPSAVAALEHAATAEPVPAVAARTFEHAAQLIRQTDPERAAHWLDHALSRAPRAVGARWKRVGLRLALGRIEDALSDVGHLEALAHGVRAKPMVWSRAGQMWRDAGLVNQAGPIFERALRYGPDDPSALAGLGQALIGEGAPTRGVSLLTRALALAHERSQPTSRIALALGRALAEQLDDLPTAIAHVSAIPLEADEGPIARGLEGRWRARLGDQVGASFAYARMREVVSSWAGREHVPTREPISHPHARVPEADASRAEVTELLREAANFERVIRRDALAAQRHLAVALRLSPHDGSLRRAHSDVGAQIAAGLHPPDSPVRDMPVSSEAGLESVLSIERSSNLLASSEAAPESVPSVEDPSNPLAQTRFRITDEGEPYEADGESATLAARAEALTRRLHADPGNHGIADELAEVLEGLGRGHELLALLTARLEDAPVAERAPMLPRIRAVLSRLAAAAELAGRADEVTLFRSAAAHFEH